MKTTKINIALLFVAILLSGLVIGQQEIIQVDKTQLDETNDTEIVIDDLINPFHNNSEQFKALIYPNPSFTGKVKMTWQDDQNVDRILLMRVGWDDVMEINIQDQKEITIDSLMEGDYYVNFFYYSELLATQKLTVIKE